MDGTKDDSDPRPLALSELSAWMSAKTFEWLLEDEKRRTAEESEREEIPPPLFAANDEDEDETSGDIYGSTSRIQRWTSSTSNPNGYGGVFHGPNLDLKCEGDNDGVEVIYVLSDSLHGHGDQPWAASRHIANLLADPSKCRALMGRNPLQDSHQHPLSHGVRFLELGSGSGLPSFTAMHCGAKVVCTDQAVPNRILSLAESAERNWQKLSKKTPSKSRNARICPYNWGDDIGEVIDAVCSLGVENTGDDGRFDMIVAADCCYIPDLHDRLLDSFSRLLSNKGIGLLPFALHGNTSDESVWEIVEKAKGYGFDVDVLQPAQLTPQNAGMGPKRGLVHTIRLARR